MSSIQLPWKFHIFFSLYNFITNLCLRSNGTVNRRILNLFDPKTSPSKTPKNGVATSDTTIKTTSHNLWFRLYTPLFANDHSTNLPIIIFFHGGGFAFYSANTITYDMLCRRLARELRAVIVSVNYRLSPEHKFPSQYEDGWEALKFLDSNFDKIISIHANPGLCFLSGDSAGGNLAHHVAVKAGEYDLCKLKIIGLITIQPFFGGEERTEAEIRHSRAPLLTVEFTDWCWKVFLPDGSDRNHPAANVFGPESSVDISQVKFPATLVLIGGFDMLKDWQRRYYEGLKKAGKEVYLVEFPKAFHGAFLFKTFNENFAFIEKIKEFMEEQLRKDSYQ